MLHQQEVDPFSFHRRDGSLGILAGNHRLRIHRQLKAQRFRQTPHPFGSSPERAFLVAGEAQLAGPHQPNLLIFSIVIILSLCYSDLVKPRVSAAYHAAPRAT